MTKSYFRDRFQISRAQVYRLIDCASLYYDFSFPSSVTPKSLEPYPLKQRLCKTIRLLAPTPQLRQLLWSFTIARWVCEESDVEHLTSKHVREIWERMQTLDLSAYNVELSPSLPASSYSASSPSSSSSYSSWCYERNKSYSDSSSGAFFDEAEGFQNADDTIDELEVQEELEGSFIESDIDIMETDDPNKKSGPLMEHNNGTHALPETNINKTFFPPSTEFVYFSSSSSSSSSSPPFSSLSTFDASTTYPVPLPPTTSLHSSSLYPAIQQSNHERNSTQIILQYEHMRSVSPISPIFPPVFKDVDSISSPSIPSLPSLSSPQHNQYVSKLHLNETPLPPLSLFSPPLPSSPPSTSTVQFSSPPSIHSPDKRHRSWNYGPPDPSSSPVAFSSSFSLDPSNHLPFRSSNSTSCLRPPSSTPPFTPSMNSFPTDACLSPPSSFCPSCASSAFPSSSYASFMNMTPASILASSSDMCPTSLPHPNDPSSSSSTTSSASSNTLIPARAAEELTPSWTQPSTVLPRSSSSSSSSSHSSSSSSSSSSISLPDVLSIQVTTACSPSISTTSSSTKSISETFSTPLSTSTKPCSSPSLTSFEDPLLPCSSSPHLTSFTSHLSTLPSTMSAIASLDSTLPVVFSERDQDQNHHELLSKTIHSLQELAHFGYMLQPYVHGRWLPCIERWRFHAPYSASMTTPSKLADSTSSFDSSPSSTSTSTSMSLSSTTSSFLPVSSTHLDSSKHSTLSLNEKSCKSTSAMNLTSKNSNKTATLNCLSSISQNVSHPLPSSSSSSSSQVRNKKKSNFNPTTEIEPFSAFHTSFSKQTAPLSLKSTTLNNKYDILSAPAFPPAPSSSSSSPTTSSLTYLLMSSSSSTSSSNSSYPSSLFSSHTPHSHPHSPTAQLQPSSVAPPYS